jgi:putative transposase
LELNKVTLQSMLQQGYKAYEPSHPLPGDGRRAVHAILACRTALLGGHVQACPVIFTIPHELHALWLANVAVITTLLFASVHDTLLELLGDEPYLGATPGILATLHTWTQTLRLHPHIHTLVTGGGLTRTGQWVAVHNGLLLPSRVVMALCRGQRLAAIRRAWHRGQRQLPAGRRPQRGEHLLNKLGREKWHVHLRERYPHGHGGLTSLAR